MCSICGCTECTFTEVVENVGTGTGKPLTGNAAIDALLIQPQFQTFTPPQAVSWVQAAAVGTGVNVTYSFLTAAPGGAPNGGTNFTAFNAAQQASALAAMTHMSQIANITFTAGGPGANIEFGLVDLGGTQGGSFTAGLAQNSYSGSVSNNAISNIWFTGSDVWLTTRFNISDTTVGTSGYSTLLHELGHAVGLDHPFEGTITPAGTDSKQFSLMSYTDHPTMPGIEPSTFLLYDILALQYLYGANMNYNAGNNTYTWATDAAFIASQWDAGGFDFIDLSNQVKTQVINLNAGTFSSIGSNGNGGNASNNFSLAFGVTIENAAGGSANDAIFGNTTNNTLRGNQGHDYMDGGAGFDFVAYNNSTSGVYVELWANRASNDGFGFYDALLNFEAVLASNNNDFLAGDGFANYLYGLAGNDQIYGGFGNDFMIGGAGSDVLQGDEGFDQFFFAAADFAVGVWDFISGFSESATSWDALGFSGLTQNQLIIADFGGTVYITTAALNGQGGIAIQNFTAAQLADQLYFY